MHKQKKMEKEIDKKIAILGMGYTGLAAGLRLLQKGYDVTFYEKGPEPGGLAVGFKEESWNWTLEKFYHHWFTNDTSVLNLASELKHPVKIVRPRTDVLVKSGRHPFDSPLSLLTFPHLSLIDKIRTGLATVFLKYLITDYHLLEGKNALEWVRKYMGNGSTDLIWNPLFTGKFGDYKKDIALTWFWARIKKRTPSLAYPEGGFQSFATTLLSEIEKLGGKIHLNSEITSLGEEDNQAWIKVDEKEEKFGALISTLPTPLFSKITAGLPEEYKKRISSISHLAATNLILVLDRQYMEKTYWLNITSPDFPFLVLAEHTNFMSPQDYGNSHILYIGNYLKADHPFIQMPAGEMLEKFIPYLQKINPQFDRSWLKSFHKFTNPFAQQVVTVDYPDHLPSIKPPGFKRIFMGNITQVYPWDRGTNYAIELGEKIAKLVNQDS